MKFEILEVVKLYVKFINEFEKELIKEYNLKDKYWHVRGAAFNRLGKAGNFRYRFHGIGCEIQKNEILCDYSIIPYGTEGEYYYICFNDYELKCFIETFSIYKNLNIKENEVKNQLQKYIDDKTLKCLYQGEIRFDSYLIPSTYQFK
ncbi:hypothetical protein O2K51_11045 [Apibacter raozihei]|uniref:DUF6896 domain-containing protein n=1 Tax=Apibacter raozihei TaxID=2500547 RepID=UPI000FE38DA6|nr:hypothetical protein [Apibacter raozihei]